MTNADFFHAVDTDSTSHSERTSDFSRPKTESNRDELCFAAFLWTGNSFSKLEMEKIFEALQSGDETNSLLQKLITLFPLKFVDFDFSLLERATERLHDLCCRHRISILPFWSTDYPRAFWLLDAPPPVLTYIGERCWESQSFSVVGSRRPIADSRFWLENELLPFLKCSSWTVISGGAMGVDQLAHGLALRANRPTLVVLPSGILNLFPKNLSELLPMVVEGGGAFMSSYGPKTEVRKYHFQARNELMILLSRWTLIAEAARRSGTYMTSQLALKWGKEMGVVPHVPVGNHGLGSLDLLASGAPMIRDSADLRFFAEGISKL